jgi:hypothetical protein
MSGQPALNRWAFARAGEYHWRSNVGNLRQQPETLTEALKGRIVVHIVQQLRDSGSGRESSEYAAMLRRCILSLISCIHFVVPTRAVGVRFQWRCSDSADG